MLLRHLRYLKCFCGSDLFSVYRLENGRFSRIAEASDDEQVQTGLLVCGRCARPYALNESVLFMLPDVLPDEDSKSFLAKYAEALPEACRKNEKDNPGKAGNADIIVNKINEMKARDQQADVYDTFVPSTQVLIERRAFTEFLHVSGRDTVIELGCGTGKITKEMLKGDFRDYIAIDFSEKSIRILLDKLDGEAKKRILFLKGDVCNLPLKDHITSKIISAQVFEHIPSTNEQVKFISELKRILKPEGLAALTIYNFNLRKRIFRKSYSKTGFHDGGIYFENFTKREIEKLFKPYFMIKMLCGINCYVPFVYKMNTKVQLGVEYVVSKTFLNGILGNLLFLGLAQNSDKNV